MSDPIQEINQHILGSPYLWFFLDYDGTLAEFAPTPDHILPDLKLIELITQLSAHPSIQVAIISGRRLSHVISLMPIPGIWKAGTYGIELQSPDGETISRLPYDQVRPVLEVIKPKWQKLISGQEGFFLEDKGWSLALHARSAAEKEARGVLSKAARFAKDGLSRGGFRLLGGDKFLEICPLLADKGKTVGYLLSQNRMDNLLPIYIGDDDKDEEAFAVIQQHGGIAVIVGERHGSSCANFRLANPTSIREWLKSLINLIPRS